MKFKQNTIVIFNSFAQTVLEKVDEAYKTVDGTEATLTSGIEGAHGPNSLHYRGLAWDFRMPQNPQKVLAALKLSLTAAYYDVLLEGDHLHVEWDPKMRRGL